MSVEFHLVTNRKRSMIGSEKLISNIYSSINQDKTKSHVVRETE
jgi:hypothetical protein